MNQDITRYLTLAVVIGPVCLLTYSPHVENKPFFATSIAATSLIHMWTRPSRRDLLVTIGIGLFLMLAYELSWPAVTRSLSTCAMLLTLPASWRLDKMLWTATARS